MNKQELLSIIEEMFPCVLDLEEKLKEATHPCSNEDAFVRLNEVEDILARAADALGIEEQINAD